MIRRLKNELSGIVHLMKIKWKYHGKVIIGNNCTINPQSHFEGANKIYPNCRFNGTMGYGSYIGSNTKLHAHIGRFTSIAPGVECNHGVHPTGLPYATTCPMFFSNKKQNGKTFADKLYFEEMRPTIIIGNDCWIGQNVFLVGGITIGNGAIVLAGAVVTKNVPPYAIVGGVPAKVIKYRYDEETIKFLEKNEWWNNTEEWFKKHWNLLNDMNALKEYYHQSNTR